MRCWARRTHGYGMQVQQLLRVIAVLTLSACGGSSGFLPEDDVSASQPIVAEAASITRVQPEDIPANADVNLTLAGMALPEKACVFLASEPCLLTQGPTARTLAARCRTGDSGIHILSVVENGACASRQPVASTPVTVSDRATPSLLFASGLASHQCYAAGRDELVDCESALAQQLNTLQDGMKTLSSPSLSHVLNANTGAYYALEECVQEARTSLVWEGKAQTGWRAGHRLYTQPNLNWDNPFGMAMSEGSIDHYLVKVNQQKLCGFDDWRLPSAEELQGLLNYGVAVPAPMGSSQYFLNTPTEARYWTGTPYADSALLHWYVDFSSGMVSIASREEGLSLRLVRGPVVTTP